VGCDVAPGRAISDKRKAFSVGTTINQLVGRRGDASRIEDLERTIERARKTLADAAALMDLEIEELWNTETDVDDPKRYDRITSLIRQAHKAMSAITDIEKSTGLGRLADKDVLNLEEARAEILRRLAGIASDEAEGSVPG
jgi:phosphoribosyl-dephospho-CoA transferase